MLERMIDNSLQREPNAEKCPFCGCPGTGIYSYEYEHTKGAFNRFAVFCTWCMATKDTGTAQTRQQALDHWNNRTAQPLNDLEILAQLDALRVLNPNDDYIIRVASAIVAKGLGYFNRADWTEKLSECGLSSINWRGKEDKYAAGIIDKRLNEKAEKANRR